MLNTIINNAYIAIFIPKVIDHIKKILYSVYFKNIEFKFTIYGKTFTHNDLNDQNVDIMANYILMIYIVSNKVYEDVDKFYTFEGFDFNSNIQIAFEKHFDKSLKKCEDYEMSLKYVVLLFDAHWLEKYVFTDHVWTKENKNICISVSIDFFKRIKELHNIFMNRYNLMLLQLADVLNYIFINNHSIYDMKMLFKTQTPELVSQMMNRKRKNIEETAINILKNFKRFKDSDKINNNEIINQITNNNLSVDDIIII